MGQEFIIGFAEHRSIGYILVPLLIEKENLYYTVKKTVRLRDVKSGEIVLNDHELELLKLIENYSDEMLIKKFSKKKTDQLSFFQNMDKDLFQNHISPYIDKYIYRCIILLMKGQTKLYLKHSKYAHLYDEDEIKVNQTFSDCTFYFNRTETGTRYNLKISHEGKTIGLLHKNIKMICTQPCCFVYLNRVYVFTHLSGKKLIPFLTKEAVTIPRQAEDKYYQSFILNTIRDFEVKATGFDIIESRPPHSTILSLEQDLSLRPVIMVKFKYDTKQYLADAVSSVFVSLENRQDRYSFRKFVRDVAWEEGQLSFIKKLGLKYKNGCWYPKEDEEHSEEDSYYQSIQWLSKNHDELQSNGYIIQQNKLNKKYFTGSQSLDIKIHSNEDWFDIHAMVKFGDCVIPFIRLRKNILNNIREFELPSGEIAILPLEWFTSYKEIFPFAKLNGNIIKLKKHHFQLLKDKAVGIERNYFKKTGTD